MQLVICTVFDAKAKAFLPPFFMRTAAAAVRAFEAQCATEGSDFQRFPEDYVLFELGVWEDESGEFSLHAGPQSLVTASAVRAMQTAKGGA